MSCPQRGHDGSPGWKHTILQGGAGGKRSADDALKRRVLTERLQRLPLGDSEAEENRVLSQNQGREPQGGKRKAPVLQERSSEDCAGCSNEAVSVASTGTVWEKRESRGRFRSFTCR